MMESLVCCVDSAQEADQLGATAEGHLGQRGKGFSVSGWIDDGVAETTRPGSRRSCRSLSGQRTARDGQLFGAITALARDPSDPRSAQD
jgi:hypothetical protein